MIIKNDPAEIQSFLTDASNLKGECSAVYFPESKEDVIQILKEANQNSTKVTVSGNGTGLAGGRVPQGGIVISLEKLNKVLEINTDKEYAIVESGVLLSDFLMEVESKGYFYPPDPTEKNCFIGGTIATNASGAKTFKYGATRNFVQELEIILSSGEELHLERNKNLADNFQLSLQTQDSSTIKVNLPDYELPVTKNASGYFTGQFADAIDLFIGSEGTLGIITKAKLNIISKSEKFISCVFFFQSESDALYFIEEARNNSYQNRTQSNQNNIDALALEFFDERSLKFLSADFPLIPEEAKSAVWFEQESTSTNEDELLNSWTDLLLRHNGSDESAWFATNEKERNSIFNFRHAISAKVNEYISKNNFRKLGTDVAVPDSVFIEFYSTIHKMAEESNLEFVTYGHFGNSHVHLNILPKTDAEYTVGKNLYSQICDLAIFLKGTISAEHGVGKIKKEYLLRMLGDEVISQMKEVKKTLDPKSILGVGNIFD